MLWAVFGFMLLAAVLVVAWPQYRAEQRLTLRSALAVVAVLAISSLIYAEIGRPDARNVLVKNNDVNDMVESLAHRLETDRDDLKGWKMLARSYSTLKRYPEAIAAYERAAELEAYGDAQTLVNLGEAIMLDDNSTIQGRASQLFENALAISPGNSKALFFGGVAAVERGDRLLAADRWESLLASSPPPEIEGIMRQRIAEWRGEEANSSLLAPAAAHGVELTINVRLDAAAKQAVDPDATVFIIARDPAQPSPPVAVVRRLASELPLEVTLDDDDAMIPGRTLSQFTRLELIVRASVSGQPIAQSGDWFGSQVIDTETTRRLDIVVSRQVP